MKVLLLVLISISVLFFLDSISWRIPVVVSATEQEKKEEEDETLYVIGDLHGDVECTKYWLDQIGLFTEEEEGKKRVWQNDKNKLLFMGDYIDKGPQSLPTVLLVKELTEQFPKYVTAIMGNHELELLKDVDITQKYGQWTTTGGKYYQLPYATVHPAEYLNFLTEEQKDPMDTVVVEALYNASLEVYGYGTYRSVTFGLVDDNHPKAKAGSSILDYITDSPMIQQIAKERLEVFQRAYTDAFQPTTDLGKWIQSLPILHYSHNTLFLHGGISSEVAMLFKDVPKSIDIINNAMKDFTTSQEIRQFIDTTQLGQIIYHLVTYRGNHPKENQFYHTIDENCDDLQNVLDQLKGVDRIAVGHTPDWNVRMHCQGKLLALDSLLGRWIRAIGNDYCPGDTTHTSRNGRYTCEKISDYCEGQIIKLTSNNNNGNVEVIQPSNIQPSQDNEL